MRFVDASEMTRMSLGWGNEYPEIVRLVHACDAVLTVVAHYSCVSLGHGQNVQVENFGS